jgi:hypothetical protein
MVSVLAIGIGMTAVLQTLSIGLSTSRVSKDYLVAGELLSQKMWQTVSVVPSEPGVTEGAFKDRPSFSYRVQVQEMFPAHPPPAQALAPNLPALPQAYGFGKVTVTVLWVTGGKEKQLSCQNYVPILPS